MPTTWTNTADDIEWVNDETGSYPVYNAHYELELEEMIVEEEREEARAGDYDDNHRDSYYW